MSRQNVRVDLDVELMETVRGVIERHGDTCCQRPKAILLNPANHSLLGWDEILGLPVLADPRVEPAKAKLLCGDHGWGGVHDGEWVWWTADGPAHHLREEESAA